MLGKKKKESTIKVNEAGEVTIEASIKDAAIKQLKKNRRLKMAIN